MSGIALQIAMNSTLSPNNTLQLLGQATTRDHAKSNLPTKRKREEICGLGSFNKPFTIKPYRGSTYDQPTTFEPVRIVGRSQLPLTFLDTSLGHNFAANCLFSAHINVLENDTQQSTFKDPNVLIARHKSTRLLYAIERVQPGIFSICRLAAWLKEKDVVDLWDPSSRTRTVPTKYQENELSSTLEWWRHAAVEVESVERPARRIKMTMLRKDPGLEKMTTVKSSSPRFDTPTESLSEAADLTSVEIVEEVVPQISPLEQLDQLIHQYMDAIYLSKTSLAYFAKGPITRIRNAFTSTSEDAPPTCDLVARLRAMLLTSKASEKKYFEKLPALVKSMSLANASDDDEAKAGKKGKKSKKVLKLSRDGVYPQEEVIIRKWWTSELPGAESAGEETLEQRIKRRVGDLRVRETLAQMILMLEIIALEALATTKPATVCTMDSGSQAPPQCEVKTTKRNKKLDDINLQLDLLLDKLCIWHATEELGILDFDTKSSRQINTSDALSKNNDYDRLHGFCVEVIVPFYMNRLPEQARMVNKKLGGPAHASPPKRKAMKPPSTSRKSGEPREPESKKSRRSLGRVATDTTGKTGSRKTPSLARCATDSALLSAIKREGSEAPLSAIPFQRSPSRDARRSMSQFRHLEGREVDLTAPSAAATAKMKQKQRVQEDLEEAILALKKPNRGLAAGRYADDIERRGLGTSSRSRKPATTVRNVTKEVQVTATPRVGRRTQDFMGRTPNHHRQGANLFARDTSYAASAAHDFCVPSSGVRAASAFVPGTVRRGSMVRDQASSSIAETPSKAPGQRLFSSDNVRRTIFATPMKPNTTSKQERSSTDNIFETPKKSMANAAPIAFQAVQSVAATPEKAARTAATPEPDVVVDKQDDKEKETSIYDALGWNDEDDYV